MTSVLFPSAFNTNNISLTLTGAEGASWFTYHPAFGQPGYVAGAPANSVFYTVIGDVPEPSTLLLATLGVFPAMGRRPH